MFKILVKDTKNIYKTKGSAAHYEYIHTKRSFITRHCYTFKEDELRFFIIQEITLLGIELFEVFISLCSKT